MIWYILEIIPMLQPNQLESIYPSYNEKALTFNAKEHIQKNSKF